MTRRLALLLLAMFAPLLIMAGAPTTLRVVDVRLERLSPEMPTWLGALQGMMNRQDGDAPVFIIQNDADAYLASELVRVYGLKREPVTAKALMDAARPTLTGQVLYDPARPWTRNVALTVAAVTGARDIALPADEAAPNVPVDLDLRTLTAEMQDRTHGYAWLAAQYGSKVDQGTYALAPEGGHRLADYITAHHLLAIDFAPTNVDEVTALREIVGKYPAGSRLLGNPDDRCLDLPKGIDAANVFARLTEALATEQHILVPARFIGNLSCLEHFPVVQPLMQSRTALDFDEHRKLLVVVYDGVGPAIPSSALPDDARSLDSVWTRLIPLLDDPAMANLPVAVQVPMSIMDYAPALYQAAVSRQRFTAAELIAAPNGTGWARPRLLQTRATYLAESADRGRQMGMTTLAISDVGDQQAYEGYLSALSMYGWRASILRPEELWLPDRSTRGGKLLAGFAGAPSNARVKNVQELRNVLAASGDSPLVIVYADPRDLPPAVLRGLQPEVDGYTLATPSQAFRFIEEQRELSIWYAAQRQRGVQNPQRTAPTLTISAPTVEGTPTPAQPITVNLKAVGMNGILVAQLFYTMWNGHMGMVDMRNAGGGTLTATIPPIMTGGTVTALARVVEKGGCAVSYSPTLTIKLPVTDGDKDGADDTLELYRGSDTKKWDTDGDGLPDGMDPQPIIRNAETATFFAPIVPPQDKAFLSDAGTSTTEQAGRVIPGKSAITYRVPLQGVPAAPCALQVLTVGAGSASLNGAEPVKIPAVPGGTPLVTLLPLTAAQVSGGTATLKFTAGDEAPLTVASIAVISNPAGPFIATLDIAPNYPTAGAPIEVGVKAYSPAGIKAVRLRYGPALTNMTTLELKADPDRGNVVFTGQLPAQANGSVLAIGVEAEDRAGNVSALPYRAIPVGRPRRHSVSLVGGRDLQGNWLPAPTWGGVGRVVPAGNASDTGRVGVRPGRYTAWLLAQPRERGIAVMVDYKPGGDENPVRLMARGVKGGMADGWYRLGTFDVTEGVNLDVTVTPMPNERGEARYGMVLLTQDDTIQPPVPYAGVDWFNSLSVSGIKEGDTLTDRAYFSVTSTGNVDLVEATVEQVDGMVTTPQPVTLTRLGDGRFVIDPRGLNAGAYVVKITGYGVYNDKSGQRKDQLLATAVAITVQK